MFKKRSKILRSKSSDSKDFFVTMRSCGQAMIEVTFSVVVIVGLLLGMIRVFTWVGVDLSSRRGAHEDVLLSVVNAACATDVYRQIRPSFYEGTPINAATINSEIFGANRMH